MGYTTDFDGLFEVTPPLKPEHAAYLKAFSGTRRMVRDGFKTAKRPDPVREAVGLPVGDNGAYFVGEGGECGQGDFPKGDFHGKSVGIVDYNSPPSGQPGLWRQWEPMEDGTALLADGEKFYAYVPWLEYLIKHFFGPWGYKLNGAVKWQGEESTDCGTIHVRDSVIRPVKDHVTSPEPDFS